ncbi:MAG: hypothetical protein WD061_00400 [Candidatus Saccharimonadales bacterium]
MNDNDTRIAHSKGWSGLSKWIKVPIYVIGGIFVLLTIVSIFAESENSDDPEGRNNETEKGTIMYAVEQAESNIDENNNCTYTQNFKDNAWNEEALTQDATTNFVNIARKIDTEKCQSFRYSAKATLTDSKGNKSDETVLSFNLDNSNRKAFEEYNWGNLQYENVGSQFLEDRILLMEDINLSIIKNENIEYQGIDENLKE